MTPVKIVRVASKLKTQLQSVGPNAEQLLVGKFLEWKSSPEDHYWFSKDVRGDDGYLFHVHLVPSNDPAARAKWDRLWSVHPKRPWSRRSDRYLLYADAGVTHGCLLIALIEDPGAHTLWSPAQRALREQFEIVAENFCVFGVIP